MSRTPAAATASPPGAMAAFSFPALSGTSENAAPVADLASFRLAPTSHPVTDLSQTASSVSLTPGAVSMSPYTASTARCAASVTPAASVSTPGAAADTTGPASPLEAPSVPAAVQHDRDSPVSNGVTVGKKGQERSTAAPADGRLLIAAGQPSQTDTRAGHKVTPPFTVGCVFAVSYIDCIAYAAASPGCTARCCCRTYNGCHHDCMTSHSTYTAASNPSFRSTAARESVFEPVLKPSPTCSLSTLACTSRRKAPKLVDYTTSSSESDGGAAVNAAHSGKDGSGPGFRGGPMHRKVLRSATHAARPAACHADGPQRRSNACHHLQNCMGVHMPQVKCDAYEHAQPTTCA